MNSLYIIMAMIVILVRKFSPALLCAFYHAWLLKDTLEREYQSKERSYRRHLKLEPAKLMISLEFLSLFNQPISSLPSSRLSSRPSFHPSCPCPSYHPSFRLCPSSYPCLSCPCPFRHPPLVQDPEQKNTH